MTPIYGGKRDMSLFRHINRELINRIVTTPVDIYKPSLQHTKENIYGEAAMKIWLQPVRICCLIDKPELEKPYTDAGIVDVRQNPIFHFLLDDLKLANIYVEVGDIIDWDNRYWEIERTDDTKNFLQKDPATQKTILDNYNASDWGWKYSMSCYTIMSRVTRASLERTYSGKN